MGLRGGGRALFTPLDSSLAYYTVMYLDRILHQPFDCVCMGVEGGLAGRTVARAGLGEEHWAINIVKVDYIPLLLSVATTVPGDVW